MANGFWKVSMGRDDFPTILDVVEWLRRGVVVVHKDTKAKGTSSESQGQSFIAPERIGDYFYLCHGNHEPSVILLGQFTAPPNVFCDKGHGYAERPFRWIRTSKLTRKYRGKKRWWAPSENSTFTRVPPEQLNEFESVILQPYFDIRLEDFGIGSEEGE